MLSRDPDLRSNTWNLLDTSGNVFDSPRAAIDSSSTPHQDMRSSWNQSATGGNLVRKRTGKPIAGGEERDDSNPEIYKENMADQSRLQISELQFDKFARPSTFSCWKIKFKTLVSSCSSFPSEAMLWIKEVEMVDSVDDLTTSRSIGGHRFPNFQILDARIASAVNKIIQNSCFKKKVSLEEHRAQKEYRFLRGRHIAHMI